MDPGDLYTSVTRVVLQVKRDNVGEAVPWRQVPFVGTAGSSMAQAHPSLLADLGLAFSFSLPIKLEIPQRSQNPLQPLVSPGEQTPCFFPATLPTQRGSSRDAHTSCWSLRRARGPWGAAPWAGRGRWSGVPKGSWHLHLGPVFWQPWGGWPPFLLVLWSQRRVLWPDQALAFPVLRPQKPQEHGLGMAQPAAPSLTRPFLAEAPTALVPHSPLPGALSSAPGPKQPPTASTGLELLLLPPSSFMPCGAAAPARVRPPPPSLGTGALTLWSGFWCFLMPQLYLFLENLGTGRPLIHLTSIGSHCTPGPRATAVNSQPRALPS